MRIYTENGYFDTIEITDGYGLKKIGEWGQRHHDSKTVFGTVIHASYGRIFEDKEGKRYHSYDGHI